MSDELLIGNKESFSPYRETQSTERWILTDSRERDSLVIGFSNELLEETSIDNVIENMDQIKSEDVATCNPESKHVQLEVVRSENTEEIEKLSRGRSRMPYGPTPSFYELSKVDEHGKNIGKWHIIGISTMATEGGKTSMNFTILSSVKAKV